MFCGRRGREGKPFDVRQAVHVRTRVKMSVYFASVCVILFVGDVGVTRCCRVMASD
jgi:hypothetical protein